MTSPLNHRKLEPKANAKKGYILFTRPLDRQYHTFSAALSKPARDEDAAGEQVRTLRPS